MNGQVGVLEGEWVWWKVSTAGSDGSYIAEMQPFSPPFYSFILLLAGVYIFQ